MNEAETRAEHIDPALKAAGWGVVEGCRVLREHGITLGRLQGGQGIYSIDMATGMETELAAWPSPDELWQQTFAEPNAWRDRFAAVPFDWKTLAPGAEPTHRPRILFLADRNILADQAYNAFSAFPDDALVRIDPVDIRRQGRVPKNGGPGDSPYFGEYPSNFFDFIVIDECHRGGASDEAAGAPSSSTSRPPCSWA